MVDKIPAEQLNAINGMKADGISEAERKKLEMQGVKDELLEKLSGTKTAEEVDKAVEAYLKEEADSPSLWKDPVGWFKSDDVSIWKKIGVGAAAVAGVALGGWAAAAALGVKGLAAVAGVAALGLGATSCTEEPDLKLEGNTTNITNNITINAQSSNKDIIDAINNLGIKLDGVVKYLMELGCSLEKMISILQDMNISIGEMASYLKEQGKQIEEIIQALAKLGVDAQEIISLILENNAQQTVIIDKLTEGMTANQKAQEEIKGLLKQIIGAVQAGNQLSEQNNTLLTEILAKMGTANDEQSIELLKEILAKLTESVEQNKEMDKKTHDLLAAILAKMDKMDAGMKAGFSNIMNLVAQGNKISEAILNKLMQAVNKLDNMNKTNQAAFTAILNAIQNLGEGTDAKLEAILNAIVNGNEVTAAQLEELRKLVVENNKIAQGTQDAVNDLKNQVSEQYKVILEQLKNGNASLDDIKNLLAEIKTGVDNNTVQLTDINDKLNFIGAVINNILTKVTGMKHETKALLVEILAKIPNGCTCSDVDLSGVIEILNKLLKKLDPNDTTDDNPNDDSGDHEGIIKDLEDYFK